jgi:formyltetrahydrofolate deformylase
VTGRVDAESETGPRPIATEADRDHGRHVLLVSCPDRPGIVAAVANFVFSCGGNIVHAEQHTDQSEGVFFQRVDFELTRPASTPELVAAFAPIAQRFAMRWQLHRKDATARVAILVSRHTHCLSDLLARWQTGELPHADIPLVISNHRDAADTVAFFGPRFVHLPDPTGRHAEAELIRLLDDAQIDLVVLARYMQILGAAVIDRYRGRIINIHHSFLPAFIGARPYRQALQRGVKIIGATAHYATEDLDEGPIIEQDVIRVSHRDSIEDLVRKGRDVERLVLARAVRAHLEQRILTVAHRTVVFD